MQIYTLHRYTDISACPPDKLIITQLAQVMYGSCLVRNAVCCVFCFKVHYIHASFNYIDLTSPRNYPIQSNSTGLHPSEMAFFNFSFQLFAAKLGTILWNSCYLIQSLILCLTLNPKL